MQNNEYNSLTEKLIQSGILQANNNEDNESNDINFFNAPVNSEEIDEVSEKTEPQNINRKRINNYDLELLKNNKKSQDVSENNVQKLIYKFFPKLYEFKVAKDALQKMNELGIDTNTLLDKTVPYGEGELRYKNLVKFIKYANEIQTKLKRTDKAK